MELDIWKLALPAVAGKFGVRGGEGQPRIVTAQIGIELVHGEARFGTRGNGRDFDLRMLGQ